MEWHALVDYRTSLLTNAGIKRNYILSAESFDDWTIFDLLHWCIHGKTQFGNEEKNGPDCWLCILWDKIMNAQTERIREKLDRREALATPRSRALGQILLCEGCCCGRTDRGFKPVPCDWIKQQWKEQKLSKTVELTISGCLGPCDLANVACISVRR